MEHRAHYAVHPDGYSHRVARRCTDSGKIKSLPPGFQGVIVERIACLKASSVQ